MALMAYSFNVVTFFWPVYTQHPLCCFFDVLFLQNCFAYGKLFGGINSLHILGTCRIIFCPLNALRFFNPPAHITLFVLVLWHYPLGILWYYSVILFYSLSTLLFRARLSPPPRRHTASSDSLNVFLARPRSPTPLPPHDRPDFISCSHLSCPL